MVWYRTAIIPTHQTFKDANVGRSWLLIVPIPSLVRFFSLSCDSFKNEDFVAQQYHLTHHQKSMEIGVASTGNAMPIASSSRSLSNGIIWFSGLINAGLENQNKLSYKKKSKYKLLFLRNTSRQPYFLKELSGIGLSIQIHSS